MHMPVLLKKAVVLLTLISLLAIVFFSFSFMARGVDGQMQGDCPFSVMGVALCPQDALAAATHHISAYQSFLNIVASSGMAALILALLVALAAALLFSAAPLVYEAHACVRRLLNFSFTVPQERKTIRWLSLFEHSPSTI